MFNGDIIYISNLHAVMLLEIILICKRDLNSYKLMMISNFTKNIKLRGNNKLLIEIRHCYIIEMVKLVNVMCLKLSTSCILHAALNLSRI